jgi:hypothetical protein
MTNHDAPGADPEEYPMSIDTGTTERMAAAPRPDPATGGDGPAGPGGSGTSGFGPHGRGGSGPSGWRAAGAVLTVLAVVLGTLSVAAWLVRRTETRDRTYQRAVSRVVINSGSGDVRLSPGPDGQVALHERLTWSWSKPVESATWDGDTLLLSFRCPPISVGPGCGIDYRLRVPAGVPVQVHTGAGDVAASGLTGPVTLGAGSGDVSVSRLAGPLSLRTGSGDVTASAVTSDRVVAGTGSGDVSLTFVAAPASVAATTGSGDVTVVVPHGTAYRVSTRSGAGDSTVSVDEDSHAAGALTARTGSGDITIAYP